MDQSIIAGGQVSIAFNADRHWGSRAEERDGELGAVRRRVVGAGWKGGRT